MLANKALSSAPSAEPVFVESVFSTYLYTGNGSTQTITNGIDLAGEGGLVWCKERSSSEEGNHVLNDTLRGLVNSLATDLTNGNINFGQFSSFNSNGFSLTNASPANGSGRTYASWTFRKQAKFFDVVTYTGNGADQTISHNLGSTPGCIIVKRTDTADDWYVYHRSLSTPSENWILLNNTGGANGAIGQDLWGPPTSTTFKVDTYLGLSTSSATYVAYLFAHDAGGFGLTGTDNVISCGSFSSTAEVSLGWEPQWILFKRADTVSNWTIVDSMRGLPGHFATAQRLRPNTSDAEGTDGTLYISPRGFVPEGYPGGTYIYIAIRRGPMKVPTSGTSVFGLSARSGTGANATVTGGQVDDAVLIKNRGSAVGDLFAARLTGKGYTETSSTAAEVAAGTTILQANPWDVMDGVKVGTTSTITNASSNTFINYLFRRAPGFFDVVCYTGTGSARTVNHNLAAVPEMMIVKVRSTANNWAVYNATAGNNKYLSLDQNIAAATSSGAWNTTSPTSSVFTVGTNGDVNANTQTYVAYLFATCPGVSKVGSYTGTGTTQQINCGFTGGARFVLIKRTDSTGDWYVWDSARGIVAGNDPYLLLNSTAAEVTSTDYIDTYSAGFEISSTAPADINANGGTYIFLAVA